MEVFENSNYLMCYNALDEVEALFFTNILNLIIKHPIDWYNFLENILKNKIMISYRNTALIVSLEILTPQLLNSFNHIYDCMLKSGIIIRSIKTKGFLIIYVYSQKISDFFQNSGFWLEYLTAYACSELGLKTYRGVLFQTNDGNIQEVDVLIDVNSTLFFIECKDTYNYSNNDLKKLANLRKKINCRSYGVFVCSKLGYDVDYEKYDIDLIRYKYDYENFKEQLKELISSKIISLNF